MITVLPIENTEEVKKYFLKENFEYNELSSGIIAKCEGEILGICLYYLDFEKMTLLFLNPDGDIILADSIIRSALHVAVHKNIKQVYYINTLKKILSGLQFIDNENSQTVKIEKLFESNCQCGK